MRTLARLIALVGPGDVACISGSYREDMTISSGGTRTRPLTVRSTPGHRARVRGRMWISNSANDVVIQDLNIDGRNLDGGELPSPTVEGDRVRFIHNDITNHRHHICMILGSIHGFGVARNVVIDGNRFHDCGRRPANNHHHSLYLENATGTRIVNNVMWASADRGIQLYPNGDRSFISHNVMVGNGVGIIFSGNEGYASSRNRVVDNVITHARLRYNIEYWWPDHNPIGSGNTAARNCVFGGAWGNIIDPQVGFTSNNNITANPRYRNRRRGDFRPKTSSGCRDLLLGVARPLTPIT